MRQLYRHSFELLTDLYQLTMAYGYWKSGSTDKEAVFHLFFRRNPFGGGYAVASGLEFVVQMLREYRFRDHDLAFLADLKGNDDQPMFEAAFLEELRTMRFQCDIDAVPEGTVVFAHEPLLRVIGPIMQCQLLETALLNIVNFQTLIATKASRVCFAAGDDPVLEFGLRRAQGIDGALTASRAAYIGGCAATSNVLAGKLFGIPVKGTHAHSWIMSFDSEPEAFEAYAAAMPNNCVFLVDTYDTIDGVRNAVQTGLKLRKQGHQMVGIRLDSGDLSSLSSTARRILDEAGFEQAAIVASNDLDEKLISNLKKRGAAINVWGVGTRLVTGDGQPALGGVYKLAAIRRPGDNWSYRVKLSEQSVKSSTPGVLQIRRFKNGHKATADMIYSQQEGIPDESCMIDPVDSTQRHPIDDSETWDDLLVPIFRLGQCVYDLPNIAAIRKRCAEQLNSFHTGIKQNSHPHQYPVGLEAGLHALQAQLIMDARRTES
ncbi:MAG: nicotinate phosphoribosyltransferase [Fuerstiella sp.]|nr:nicotinate phosphoribosyltransferase [Fuerstiella sp.]